MFGLRPQRQHQPDEFIGKVWRVSTTSAELAAALDRRCDGSHRHVEVVGGETAATAFYPELMAKAVHQGIRSWAQGRARPNSEEPIYEKISIGNSAENGDVKSRPAAALCSLAGAATESGRSAPSSRGAFVQCPTVPPYGDRL